MADRTRILLLFAGAALISGVTMLEGIQPNDEGLMLQAAARIADGQVPYRDFWWFYPPGQPYLLAGLWELFGPSLLPWRVLRVLCDAGVAVLVWALARRAGASQRLALAAWLVAALAMAYPSGPHPFPPTLAMCLGALLLMERRPALAGALAGLAAFWRIEFAAYLALGILVAYALRPGGRERVRARARPAVLFAGAAAAVAAVLYVPVVAAAGLSDSFDLLVRYPVEDFARLPVAAVSTRLRRPAQHRLGRRLPRRLGGAAAPLLPPAGAGAWAGRRRSSRWDWALNGHSGGRRSRPVCSPWGWRTTSSRGPTSSTPRRSR